MQLEQVKYDNVFMKKKIKAARLIHFQEKNNTGSIFQGDKLTRAASTGLRLKV